MPPSGGDAYTVSVLQLSYSSPAALTVPPGSEDVRRAARVLGPIAAFALLVIVQAPSIGELWFILAHLILLVLANRRMPRVITRALASRPSAV
jgi:hypothetical protein